jgi:ribonuclease HI
MELTAAIMALLALKKPCDILLYSDSNYVIKGMTEWMKSWQAKNFKTSSNKTIENLDLWLKLVEAAKPHKISWHWIKAHAGHQYNELVDYEARSEAIKLLQK